MILVNITKLCDERGISIARLERETGIGNGTVARWDTSSPRVDSLQKVANYFSVTVDALLVEQAQTKDTA